MYKKTLLATSTLAASLLLSACGSSSDKKPDAIDAKGLEGMQSLLNTANQAKTALEQLQNQPQKTPFLVRLNIGQDAVLATQGVLSAHARCVEGEGEGEGTPGLELYYVSSSEGSISDEFRGYLDANEAYVFSRETSDEADVDIDESSIISSTGDHISINGETTMLSVNAQGTDCMVAGVAITMKGAEAPAFTIEAPSEEVNF